MRKNASYEKNKWKNFIISLPPSCLSSAICSNKNEKCVQFTTKVKRCQYTCFLTAALKCVKCRTVKVGPLFYAFLRETFVNIIICVFFRKK